MIIARKCSFVGGMLILLLFACSTTRLKSVWKDTTYKGDIKSVMVVGLAGRYDVRRFFEQEFVKKFKELGVEAIASVDTIKQEKELNADIILAEARKHRTNMIMVTSILSFDDTSDNNLAVSSGVFSAYYRNIVIYIESPGYYSQSTQGTQSISLATKLYATTTEKLIWSVTSKSLDPYLSEYNIIKSLSKVIIKRLYDDELLR